MRPFAVEGSCGHKFNVFLPISLHKYLHPELLRQHLSGEICHSVCPHCKEKVVFYLGFFVDTLEERIGIYPKKWISRNLEKESKYDVIIYEEYGKPFKNLEKYLLKKGIINENGNLSDEYVPDTLSEHMQAELGVWRPREKTKKNECDSLSY